MWFNRIKQALAVAGLKTSDIQTKIRYGNLIVDQKDVHEATTARVKLAFKQQWHNIQTRAMMPHDPKCKDNWTCTKAPCFKWEPDKIVGKPFGYIGQQDSLAKISRMKDNDIIASKLIK